MTDLALQPTIGPRFPTKPARSPRPVAFRTTLRQSALSLVVALATMLILTVLSVAILGSTIGLFTVSPLISRSLILGFGAVTLTLSVGLGWLVWRYQRAEGDAA